LGSHQQKPALISLCNTSHWRSAVAFTFNLKQSIKTGIGTYLIVDELTAKKAFKEYMRQLNRRIYSSANRRHAKRLRVIPILEKSANQRWHYHAIMEPPSFMDRADFGKLAMALWLKTDFGYEHGDVTLNPDVGWITYMAKLRTKSEFEHYYDCIDTETFFNPAAGA
jgi:hypothetical protein